MDMRVGGVSCCMVQGKVNKGAVFLEYSFFCFYYLQNHINYKCKHIYDALEKIFSSAFFVQRHRKELEDE